MTAAGDGFAASRDRFEVVAGWLGGEEAAGLRAAGLESRLDTDGRELLRQLLQDHLDLRAAGPPLTAACTAGARKSCVR